MEIIRGKSLQEWKDYCKSDDVPIKTMKYINVLEEQLEAINYTRCSLQLKDLKEPTLEEWLKDNFIPIGNNGFTNRNEDTIWTKSELTEIHATLHL